MALMMSKTASLPSFHSIKEAVRSLAGSSVAQKPRKP